MPSITNTALAIIVSVSMGFFSGSVFMHHQEELKWANTINSQKIEAASILQAATEKVIARERENEELNKTIEVQNEKNQIRVNAILDDNRSLARKRGGLRDPGSRKDCAPPTATNINPLVVTTAPSSSALSGEATEFLLTFAADADRAASYAETCHDWLIEMKARNPDMFTRENPQ